jgi:U2-associated protein SR140
MAFCLEHGEAASEVANVIISSLLVSSTPVPRKMARLHLISDIVHNSAVTLPSAWKYRQEFQNRLGLVFDHLSAVYHSFSGRMTAETFKRQVVAVIDVWDDRIVFPPHQTAVWKERLDGKEPTKQEFVQIEEKPIVQPVSASARFKLAFKPVVDPQGEADMDLDEESDEPQAMSAGEAPNNNTELDELDGAPIVDEDIDGEALDDDVDGAPLEDVDGDPLDDDVDGAPVDLE